MTKELLTGADLKGPLQLNGAAGTSGQILTSAGTGAIPTWSPAGGFTGGTLTSNLTVAAGTTSLSPLTFQSGTNLTSATAGAMEYDGKVIYSTPAARGVMPSMQYYRLNSNLAGSNVNTAQSVFGVGVTLSASTIYAIESFFILQKTAGTTSHTISSGFGGTATINNIAYGITWTRSDAALTASAMSQFSAAHSFSTLASAFVLSGSITSAAETIVAKTYGTVSINVSGTFISQYQLSAAPGGAYSTLAGSYIAIWPIGAAGANTSVGPWA
jgi:hypothetical protein